MTKRIQHNDAQLARPTRTGRYLQADPRECTDSESAPARQHAPG